MGGHTDHIELVEGRPGEEGSPPSCGVPDSIKFNSIDVRLAACQLEEDRSRLLDTIEAGFGELTAFNVQAQRVLARRRAARHCA